MNFYVFLIVFTFLGLMITETGLPGVLFGMLDTESDSKIVKYIHETLTFMLHSLAEDDLNQWIRLCKEVLATVQGKLLSTIPSSKDQILNFECTKIQAVEQTKWKAGHCNCDLRQS